MWFNQPYVENYIKAGKKLYISGKLKSSYEGLELNVTDYEIINTIESSQKVLPIYPLTEGLNPKNI